MTILKKILAYEVIKLLMALGGCLLLFSLLPFSLYVLFLPVDLIGWLLIRSGISAGMRVGISIVIYLVAVLSSVVWIQTGHGGLEFLLDVDWLR
jgi:hypothetical protein